MSEIEKVLKSVVLGGIGAAAAVVEKGGEIAKTLVEKGEETLRQNQDVADQIKEKVKSACDAAKVSFDIARMTPEERAELRRQLDAYEAAEAAFTQADDEAEEVTAEDEAPAEAPVTEDAYTVEDENKPEA